MSASKPPDSQKARRSWTRTPPPDHTPSTREWVEIARELLISEGIVEVKIDRIAKIAGVTRGGFYWRFKNRDDLLAELLQDWKSTNTNPYLAILQRPGSPQDRLRALALMQIAEADYSADYDRAVRHWAGLSAKVADAVREVDALRVQALNAVFLDAGFEADEALIRARVTYFHQVGYDTIHLQESNEARLALVDLYLRVLMGSSER